MKNANMPAMPQSATENGYGCNYSNEGGQVPTGMTKRELIAMHTMSALIGKADSLYKFDDAAEDALKYTDALLKELEK